MGFMKLNRFGDPSGRSFDAAEVVEQVRGTFPNIHVMPDDQLTLSADRAAAGGAPDHVVRTLRRNQQAYGPAIAFEIDVGGGETIQGRARRYDVTFLFNDTLAEVWRQRLLDFVQGLGAGRLEQAAERVAKGA